MNEFNQVNNDGINLDNIINFIFRRKSIVGTLTGLSLIFSTIYSFNKTKVWQGEFQIVIKNKNNMVDNMSADVSQLIQGMDTFENKLRTEVEILKSPSILMGVFESYKKIKQQESPKFSNLNYRKWIGKNLDIRLIKSTEIVNLAYRDTNKDLVLPVLNDIVEVYKDYSIKDKVSGLNESINYLKDQIDIYANKTEKLSKKLYLYEKDNKLFTISNGEKSPTTTETIRIRAENDLNSILSTISLIKTAEEQNDLNSIYNIASTNIQFQPFLQYESRISKINTKLSSLQSTYLYDTSEINSLKSELDQNLYFLAKEFKKFLNTQKLVKQKIVQDNTRNADILLESFKIRNNLARDEKVLKYLEQQLQFQTLEQKKNKKPWELITNPTLLDYPVSPVKKRIVFIGTFIGFLISIITAKLLDKYNGLITKNENIYKIFGYEPKLKINLRNYFVKSFDKEILEIINNAKSSKILNTLVLGEMTSFEEEKLKSLFKAVSLNIDLNIIYELEEIDASSLDLIIVSEFGQQYRKLSLIADKINQIKQNRIPYLLIKKRLIEEL